MRSLTVGRHEWRPYMGGRDESRPYPGGVCAGPACRGAIHRARVVAAALLTLAHPAFAQPPTVDDSPERLVIANAHYRATLQRASGTLFGVALPDGTELLGADRLYSDHGLYPEPHMVGSDGETNAAVELTRDGERVTVSSRGVLRGEGELADPQRRIEYAFSYAFDASPTIHIQFSATPNFTVEAPSGFFSYLIGVPRYAEWFAKSAEGVIFQPAGSISTRTYQSSLEPLDPNDPWMGVLLPDGGILAWSGFQGGPPLTNVFMHESGQGATGVFLAWLSGPGVRDFTANEPWTAEFGLHVWGLALSDRPQLPGFLR